MPEISQPANNVETRILEELVFIADHMLAMEKQLQELVIRLDSQRALRESLRSI